MDADANITVGQWTKSEPWHMTNHAVSQSDKMAGRMCAAALASDHQFPSASASMSSVHRDHGRVRNNTCMIWNTRC